MTTTAAPPSQAACATVMMTGVPPPVDEPSRSDALGAGLDIAAVVGARVGAVEGAPRPGAVGACVGGQLLLYVTAPA